MGYRPLTPHDEWEIERQLAKAQPASARTGRHAEARATGALLFT
jgi:hypothetical protein